MGGDTSGVRDTTDTEVDTNYVADVIATAQGAWDPWPTQD